MSRAVVIGNGESRRAVDLERYRMDHTLIGCNAIYRDHQVDHLICCDRRMAMEATSDPVTADTLIYVRSQNYNYFRKIQKHKNIRELPPLCYQGESKKDQPDHWGSGGYAVLLAAVLAYQDITLIGFDLYPCNGKINNIYKDTINYGRSSSSAVDYSYWIYQIAQVMRYHCDKNFTVLNHSEWMLPADWQLCNVSVRSFDEITIDNKYLN